MIEKRHGELSEKLKDLSFDNNDIYDLLESTTLSIKEKNIIIDSYDDNSIIEEVKILELLSNC
ncbi:hypothetical protein EZS27_038039 [termite gut metagenome]|uniref:Uncharacterized protein n=1 Tax=termite gut metagenome TaxID=433724 RepID=A0A5J4PQ81_9ZZZZ